MGRPAGVLWPEPPREVANCCQHVERDAPLQTAARTGVVFSLLSVPCPPAARVSACVPPMPKLGGVYHCTNSSSDLPPSLEGAPRWRASGRAVRTGRWVSGKLQGGLGSGGGGRGTAEQHRCVSRSGSVGAGTEAGCKLELAGGALIWRVGVTLEPVEPVGGHGIPGSQGSSGDPGDTQDHVFSGGSGGSFGANAQGGSWGQEGHRGAFKSGANSQVK